MPTLGFPTTPTEKPTVHHILPYKCTESPIDVLLQTERPHAIPSIQRTAYCMKRFFVVEAASIDPSKRNRCLSSRAFATMHEQHDDRRWNCKRDNLYRAVTCVVGIHNHRKGRRKAGENTWERTSMCPRDGRSEAIAQLFSTFAKPPSRGGGIGSSSVWNSRLVRIVREVWDTERSRVS